MRAVDPGRRRKLMPLLQALADKAAALSMPVGKAEAADAGSADRPGRGIVPRRGAEEAQPFLTLLRDLARRRCARRHRALHHPLGLLRTAASREPLEGVRPGNAQPAADAEGLLRRRNQGAGATAATARHARSTIEDGLVRRAARRHRGGRRQGRAAAARLHVGAALSAIRTPAAGSSLRITKRSAASKARSRRRSSARSKAADADPAIPRDRAARLALLRRGLIPWLAGIDPDTGAPRRRVARLSEIPAEARPLIQHLVEQRLLATDVNKDTGEATIEPAHEALLRQWGLLEGWLTEDAGLARRAGGRQAREPRLGGEQSRAGVAMHTNRSARRRRAAHHRPDLAANLEPTDRDYIAACRKAEAYAKSRKRRLQALIYLAAGRGHRRLVGMDQPVVSDRRSALVATVRPYMLKRISAACAERECRDGAQARRHVSRMCKRLPRDGGDSGWIIQHGFIGLLPRTVWRSPRRSQSPSSS